jgi:cell division protein FtsB
MFWIAILVMFAILFVSQMESYNELQAQLAQTNANIERAQAEQSRLEQQLTFFDNDFYIEQLARERGLVRQNEIVFRNIAE